MVNQKTLRGLVAVALPLAILTAPARGDITTFNFDGNLAADPGTGPSTLGYFNGVVTSSAVSFGTTQSFGIADFADGVGTVMRIPAFSPLQGIELIPNRPANGGGSLINQYTMIFDVYITGTNWFAFYQTNNLNLNDSEFFKNPGPIGGIGINGNYSGGLAINTWARVGVVVDLTQPTANRMRKFINGVFVGQNTGITGVDGRWAMFAGTTRTLLFTDNNNETTPAFVGAFLFADEAFSDAQMQALGGPSAFGFVQPLNDPIPEPSTWLISALVLGIVGVVGVRRARIGRSVA
ncbi:protein of unknown function DUF1555 [Isosphaera pallida ATCC 43644]|uniref:PEP-CTERM protein-sorting domain-containing protein n=1 Tax=Isosphaera pallida (strain ATCC 43644 / DSM 9630 / IS1B) TaxID=575540 RepID=E8R5L5_ISOPI|nr:PEP-CTERM sorting domain-containing protein [Isosphaera pallida]ADV61764.1 protein of unknown function DUF1555 [Isosphaera pallida ATCC 43644]